MSKIETAEDLGKVIKESEIELLDFRFLDLFNTWHHITVPAKHYTNYLEGVAFDGSSIRGWKSIDSSDMKLLPDVKTARLDPFTENKTLVLLGDVVDPVTEELYTNDPRGVAKKSENYLRSTGIADTSYFGAEAEFFIFDGVSYNNQVHSSSYSLESDEGYWSSNEYSTNHKIASSSGYFPVTPADSNADLRNQMILTLENMGFQVERGHHEVAPAQHEINYKFNTLMAAADDLQWFKYTLKNLARLEGKILTFMPKPLFSENGSGMHSHQSLWKGGEPLFAGDGYSGLSQLALYYIGGILKHAPALAALTNPLTNSYKRLVPGFEAPINLAYSARNRSATIRIPVVDSAKGKRIEYRCPDSGANGYLAFSAMMMAGLDGIQNKIDPGEPMDVNIYDLPPEKLHTLGKIPSNLDDALNALEEDHDFLLKGEVFSKELIQTWISYKRENEARDIYSRPHPQEFALYLNI